MKKIGIFAVLFCLIFTLLSMPYYVSATIENTTATNENQIDNPAPVINSCNGIDATAPLLGVGKLVDNAESVFLYEANSKTLMYAWNADVQMYPASFVKILTAIIAIENGNLEDVVTVTESAISSIPYDAASAELVAEERMTLKDLLYCLLLDSANDAAAVIAEHISGDQAAFVLKMNQYVQDIGCINSVFTNAHGLHDDEQYTTARDVGRILEAALKNEVFYSIFTATKYTVPQTNKSEARELITGNAIMDESSKLYYDPRVVGGRTGVTANGKRCFAALAENETMQVISIVMGSESEYQEDGYSAVRIGGYQETSTLLDAGFNGYKSAQILYANQALLQCQVTEGNSDVIIGPAISVSTVIPENVTMDDLTFQYANGGFNAPIQKGDSLTTVQVWYGNMCLAQAELVALNNVENINDLHNYGPPAEKKDFSILWIILLIILAVCVVTFLILRFRTKIIASIRINRSKRYRRSRRRSR